MLFPSNVDIFIKKRILIKSLLNDFEHARLGEG